MNPVVSVCIPVYNAEKTITATLQSILAQHYPNFTVTLVDNCSTDNTRDVIKANMNTRCTLVQNEENVGGEGNFTRCMSLAKGKYTAIYHADDLYKPDMIAAQVAFLEQHPDVGAVFTGADFIDENGKIIGHHRLDFLENESTTLDFTALFKLILRHHNFLICPCAMVRTEIYQEELKTWRGDVFGSSADLDTWLRIAQQHKVGIINRPLMQYRISTTQGSYILNRIRTVRAPFLAVMEHYFHQPDVASRLTEADKRYLTVLELTDIAQRTLNSIAKGAFSDAKILTKSFWRLQSIQLIFINTKSIKSYLLMLCITTGNTLMLKKIVQRIAIKLCAE